MADDAALELMTQEEENLLYEMSNLVPKDTGLPMTIWIGPKARARHDVRVKVCRTHGSRMDILNMSSVAVRPEPRLVEGALSADDLRQVTRWIELNAAAVIDYWNGDVTTLELGQVLKKV